MFDVLLFADFWYAYACEGVDVVGGVGESDEEVEVGFVGGCFVFAFVHLAGVIGGDAGVHDGGDGQGGYVFVGPAGGDGCDVVRADGVAVGGRDEQS